MQNKTKFFVTICNNFLNHLNNFVCSMTLPSKSSYLSATTKSTKISAYPFMLKLTYNMLIF